MHTGRDVCADARYTPDGTRQTHIHTRSALALRYFGRWGRNRSDLASVHMCTSVSSGSLYIWGSIGVWHMFSVLTHFSIHLDLITSLSGSDGKAIWTVTSLSVSIWTDFETWLQQPRVSSIIRQQGLCHVK